MDLIYGDFAGFCGSFSFFFIIFYIIVFSVFVFRKNYFFHSELRIKKMKAILHILKTSDSSHWSSLASDVFGFLIFAFSMQILNSEWLGVKRDFLLKIVRIRDCEQCSAVQCSCSRSNRRGCMTY